MAGRVRGADWLLSALIALVLVAVAVAVGLAPHRQHARAGAADQRLLVAAARAVPGAAVLAGTAEHHTVGYADDKESCATETSVRLRTATSPTAVLQVLGAHGLAHLEVDTVAAHVLRARAYRTFGFNPFDWACWQ